MEKILDKFGFSEYKKRAYLALIKLEKGTVGRISKKANIPSSKIYETLTWLYENGYISLIGQEPLTYKANDPKTIFSSEVKTKIDELKELEKEIKKINTTLDIAEKGNFQIVYGRDAFFKKVKEAVSKSNKSIIAIVKNWRLDSELIKLNLEFTDCGGKMRFLGPLNKENQYLVKEWVKSGAKVKKFIPESTRFTVWDGKIISIGFKDNKTKDYFSLWIENEYLGKILTQHFDKIWKNTKN